jgi:hypothetical protein
VNLRLRPSSQVVYEGEKFWMSQRALAALFAVGAPAINKHLKNIFESGELDEKGTISKRETVRQEGGREVRRTRNSELAFISKIK